MNEQIKQVVVLPDAAWVVYDVDGTLYANKVRAWALTDAGLEPMSGADDDLWLDVDRADNVRGVVFADSAEEAIGRALA